ncbi:hypothetical protein QYE76_063316 [Lolium multiflorum]|uniref:Uncharacterized protein n=1 Tax=Lolium multiflorum TaxID=4521 RepID=A0AAD8W6F9_LOLMU|nr:hypothetical protein QYE76_063316 [Lolium multiflorum]
MQWHAEREKPEEDPEMGYMLTHPSDAGQWEALDIAFPRFGGDARNIRLGMSTDGLNPFGNQSSTHSTWPVFVWPYNLPPWLCTKQRYIHLSILIQGPKQPGVDMHLYLGLLKEELDTLWKTPPRTWDAYTRTYFDMRAALITTVTDYPGYAYVSAQVGHGFNGCVKCGHPRIYSYQGIPGPRKPCTQVLEGGFAWITRGENAVICSMVKMSPMDPHARGAAQKSMIF